MTAAITERAVTLRPGLSWVRRIAGLIAAVFTAAGTTAAVCALGLVVAGATSGKNPAAVVGLGLLVRRAPAAGGRTGSSGVTASRTGSARTAKGETVTPTRSGRRILALFYAVAASAAAASMMITLFLMTDTSLVAAGPSAAAQVSSVALDFSVRAWVLIALLLAPCFLLPGFIGGYLWIAFLNALGEDHWTLYALGGALTAAAVCSILFGPPTPWATSGAFDPTWYTLDVTFAVSGATGGATYRWSTR